MIIGIDASRANHSHKSGVEWYAFFIIQELKKIIPENIKVILYSDKPLQGALAELPINWKQKILDWPPQRLWTHIRLSLEMIQNPPDIFFIPAHVSPFIHPQKTVMTVHDVAAIHFPQTYNWFERWYSVASAKYAVKNLAGVIVPSESVKNDLLKFESKNKNIKVIAHGFNIDFSRLIPDEELKKIKQKYNLPAKYILSIGRLEEKKNTARLIAAFDTGVGLGLDIELVLVGSPGHGYEKIVRALDASLYKNKIKIIPWVEENELIGIVQAAELFVFLSLYEGFGLPVLQAFASGIPVIVSNVGSLPEVAGNAALYVDPFNIDESARTMLELSNDSSRRAELIERGLLRAQEFSWEKSAKQTWDFLSLVTPP